MGSLFTNIKWKLPELKFKKEKHLKKVNYENPGLTWKEEIFCLAEGSIIVTLFAYFFYRSIIAFFILLPAVSLYRKEKKKGIYKERKRKLEEEFKETMQAVQTNLQSGYSMENAFVESYGYVVGIFGENCDMAKELLWIKKGIKSGDTLEHLLIDLAKRCPESAIEDFSYIYSVACKTGGNWNEIFKKTITGISQRMEIKEEIEIMIHGKKLESKVMCLIPFFILFYMDATSKGYFDVLYHNVPGIVIMTFCAVVYLAAFYMTERLTDVM